MIAFFDSDLKKYFEAGLISKKEFEVVVQAMSIMNNADVKMTSSITINCEVSSRRR